MGVVLPGSDVDPNDRFRKILEMMKFAWISKCRPTRLIGQMNSTSVRSISHQNAWACRAIRDEANFGAYAGA